MDFNADSAHEFITVFSNIGLEQAGIQPWPRKYMTKVLLREISQFIGHWTLKVTDEALLPVFKKDFYALNYLLAIHFPELHSDWRWQSVVKFYYRALGRQSEDSL